MGRILFLSIAAFLAYKYISRSNKLHSPRVELEEKVQKIEKAAPAEQEQTRV